MKRTTDRVRYLTNENQRLQAELDAEQERFDFEKGRLQQKLEEAREETAEARQVLSLERSYFETATRLLELGLERERKNVNALEEELMQYDQHGYHDNHDHPYHDDLPPFETWEATGAYQQPDHHHQYHHPQHHEEVFEDFQPQVRPHDEDSHYHQQNGHMYSQHEVFQHQQEPQSFHGQHDGQTKQQQSYTSSNANGSTRRTPTATTTVMDADSIRANLGINDIRDPLYR